MRRTTTPILLLINDQEAQLLQDALTAFAQESNRQGDPMNESTRADELWERLDAIKQVSSEDARQVVKAMGMGRYRGRPQG